MKITFGSWSKKASEKKRSRKKKTRTVIAKLFALRINYTRIVITTFLKFLKLTGNLLIMSSDNDKFLIKRETCKKNGAVDPDFSF